MQMLKLCKLQEIAVQMIRFGCKLRLGCCLLALTTWMCLIVLPYFRVPCWQHRAFSPDLRMFIQRKSLIHSCKAGVKHGHACDLQANAEGPFYSYDPVWRSSCSHESSLVQLLHHSSGEMADMLDIPPTLRVTVLSCLQVPSPAVAGHVRSP